ncbi:DMP19 family protein [Comamonas thiooxydans]|uniref:DMP19 family protein n=1 Tax=Comamonas thiooxydans TaxID=363952 RepID=UPI003D0112BA
MDPRSNRITGVRIDEQTIWLALADGRELAEPIKRHIRLESAAPEQRLHWVLTDEDHGLNWPGLWQPSPEGMVSVWDLDQDSLYNQAMGALLAAQWDITRISPAQHELVALWRMEADINNGGFLQFLGNWGVENHQLTLQALQAIGAPLTRQCLQDMFAVLKRFEETSENVDFSDLPALLTDAEHEQLQELEEAFWDYPEPLNKLVVMHYGPVQ